jgi:GrpB-like predicted nucleotidyltransferase (UPF0157 family)/ribosomal protein S18 acetylase RimI-like enzyme
MSADDVQLVAYDPRWPEMFCAEAERLRTLLGPGLVLRIEHIGSTAVAGLRAKPVIDIPSFELARQSILPRLRDDGWEYLWREDRPPGHMMFVRRNAAGVRTNHLHIAPAGHPMWDRLAFRDYLRSNLDEARRYEQLKRRLASEHAGDREAYTEGKGEYVRRITALALEALRPANDDKGPQAMGPIIRPATVDDAAGLAAVRVASWRAAYRQSLPEEFLARMSVADDERRWREMMNRDGREDWACLVAGAMVGFVTFGPNRDGEAETVGEVFAIYLSPDTWGQGWGSAMWDAAARRLRARGFEQVVVWVFGDNMRARRFYERRGMVEDAGKKNSIAGADVIEVRYRTRLCGDAQ